MEEKTPKCMVCNINFLDLNNEYTLANRLLILTVRTVYLSHFISRSEKLYCIF